MVPASKYDESFMTVFMSLLKTPAASPYGVEFARAIASSTSWYFKRHTTGPKISSRTTVISSVQSANTVGFTKYPLQSPSRSPPHTQRAPSSLPLLMKCKTRSMCSLETNGPWSLSSQPAPMVRASALAFILSTNTSYIESGTKIREEAVHTCPILKKIPSAAHATAASMSASAHTISGDFPPSSRDTFFRFESAEPRRIR
mmetsp:Transcript_17901/g.20456  ORF Transcript_17901/g.20456 Transcript_17901/m.20456 type:complete len:201 (+) Transcript_17901:385-987(+)